MGRFRFTQIKGKKIAKESAAKTAEVVTKRYILKSCESFWNMTNFHLYFISYWHCVATDDIVLLSRIEVLPACDRPSTTLSHSVRLKFEKADVCSFLETQFHATYAPCCPQNIKRRNLFKLSILCLFVRVLFFWPCNVKSIH